MTHVRFLARAGLAARREVVEVLPMAGAQDVFIARLFQARFARIAALANRLDALSPLAVLGRGYAVCWNAAGDSIIRSSRDVQVGDALQVTLAHGAVGCRVERTLDPPAPETRGSYTDV